MAVRRPPIAYTLKVAAAAGGDINAIADDEVRASIWVLIQELQKDQLQLANLLDDRFGQGPGERFVETLGVQIVGEFSRHNPKRDVWRFKFWDLENQGKKYRAVYMFLPRPRMFIVLAVLPRDKSTYDFSNPVYQRICADYDRFLGNYG